MYTPICDNSKVKIRPIKFQIPITIDLTTYDIPERVIEIIDDNTYLSLFIEAGKYNKPNRSGNTLLRTARSSYLDIKLTEGGFTGTFDYSEYEIVKLLRQIALNSIRFKEYITVLDYVGLEENDIEFTIRTGVIKELTHTGTFNGDTVIVNGIEKIPRYIENGFSLVFSEDKMYYV